MELTTRRQAISMSGIRFSLVCPHHLTLGHWRGEYLIPTETSCRWTVRVGSFDRRSDEATNPPRRSSRADR